MFFRSGRLTFLFQFVLCSFLSVLTVLLFHPDTSRWPPSYAYLLPFLMLVWWVGFKVFARWLPLKFYQELLEKRERHFKMTELAVMSVDGRRYRGAMLLSEDFLFFVSKKATAYGTAYDDRITEISLQDIKTVGTSHWFLLGFRPLTVSAGGVDYRFWLSPFYWDGPGNWRGAIDYLSDPAATNFKPFPLPSHHNRKAPPPPTVKERELNLLGTPVLFSPPSSLHQFFQYLVLTAEVFVGVTLGVAALSYLLFGLSGGTPEAALLVGASLGVVFGATIPFWLYSSCRRARGYPSLTSGPATYYTGGNSITGALILTSKGLTFDGGYGFVREFPFSSLKAVQRVSVRALFPSRLRLYLTDDKTEDFWVIGPGDWVDAIAAAVFHANRAQVQ